MRDDDYSADTLSPLFLVPINSGSIKITFVTTGIFKCRWNEGLLRNIHGAKRKLHFWGRQSKPNSLVRLLFLLSDFSKYISWWVRDVGEVPIWQLLFSYSVSNRSPGLNVYLMNGMGHESCNKQSFVPEQKNKLRLQDKIQVADSSADTVWNESYLRWQIGFYLHRGSFNYRPHQVWS